MWALLLEAGVAMFLLVGIVWWTMFAGEKPPPRPLREPPKPTQIPPPQDAATAQVAPLAADEDTKPHSVPSPGDLIK